MEEDIEINGKGKILENMIYRDLIDYAKEVYNKAYDYAQMANNKKAIIASCMYLGRIEKELHNYNKAIVYYNEAITLSKEINASEMLVSALNDLALGYMYSKDFQNALHYIKESIKIAEKDSLEINESRYTTIGQIYLKLNQLDSAEFYIKKALASSNVVICVKSTSAYFLTASIIVIRSNGLPKSISMPR